MTTTFTARRTAERRVGEARLLRWMELVRILTRGGGRQGLARPAHDQDRPVARPLVDERHDRPAGFFVQGVQAGLLPDGEPERERCDGKERGSGEACMVERRSGFG